MAVEVEKQNIPATEEYKRRLVTVTTGYLFSQFVEKIIFPDVNVFEALQSTAALAVFTFTRPSI